MIISIHTSIKSNIILNNIRRLILFEPIWLLDNLDPII